MSTAQSLRDAAVAFPMKYVVDLDSQILWLHLERSEKPRAHGSVKTRTFMLIVACSLDGCDQQLYQDLSAAPRTVDLNSQDWAGMDGAIAFHLIERHADNWSDTGLMMDEWLSANQTLPNESTK